MPKLVATQNEYILADVGVDGTVIRVYDSFVRCSKLCDVINKPGLMKNFYGKYGNETCDRIMRESSEFGTKIHGLIDARLKGSDPIMSQEDKAIVDEYFKTTAGWEFVIGEQNIVNKELKYAGRFDQLYKINGEYVLTDVKTGSFVSPENFIQATAYTMANICNDEAELIPELDDYMRQVKKVCLVHLLRGADKKPIAKWEIISRTLNEDDYAAVRSVVKLHRWLKDRGAKKHV